MAEDDSEIESLTDEELDALPISTVKDGEVVTYPNAEALLDDQEEALAPPPQVKKPSRVVPHELMIRALQKKLAGDTDEDSELNISSHVYSFQEGIRKLILFRPIFTRQLFEKLIGKIDALINAEEMPVKTYEEQLCEEWFKEKIISIANTKKTERQKTDSQREIAIDYSRIRAKYILKKEDTVQLVLPDIRLKREDIQRASLIIYYQNSVVHQQNLSWYGNELGKTLNGISVTLQESDLRVRL